MLPIHFFSLVALFLGRWSYRVGLPALESGKIYRFQEQDSNYILLYVHMEGNKSTFVLQKMFTFLINYSIEIQDFLVIYCTSMHLFLHLRAECVTNRSQQTKTSKNESNCSEACLSRLAINFLTRSQFSSCH